MTKKLSKQKAALMLHEGKIHGKGIIDKQRKYFTYTASGGTPKADGGEEIKSDDRNAIERVMSKIYTEYQEHKPQLFKDFPITDVVEPVVKYITGKGDESSGIVILPTIVPKNLGNIKPSKKYFDKLYHYSDNPNLNYSDIDLNRIGVSQMKKRYLKYGEGELPSGFYTTKNPKDVFMGGPIGYETYIPKTSKIKDLASEGRITDRISLNELKKLRSEGYDVIKGKNMIGKEEWIPLDKNKLVGWNKFTENRKLWGETHKNGGRLSPINWLDKYEGGGNVPYAKSNEISYNGLSPQEARELYESLYKDYLDKKRISDVKEFQQKVRTKTNKFAQDYIVPAIKTAASFTPAGPAIGLMDAYNAYKEGDNAGAVIVAGLEALPYGLKYLPDVARAVKNVDLDAAKRFYYTKAPWTWKPDPNKYYHRSPNLDNIINKETNQLVGFGQSDAGRKFNELATPGRGGINLLKPANSDLYFAKGTPLDWGRYNKSGQGYQGPFLVEKNADNMVASSQGRHKKFAPSNIEGYAISREPINKDDVTFLKEDWLRGYKKIKYATGGEMIKNTNQQFIPIRVPIQNNQKNLINFTDYNSGWLDKYQ